MLRHAARSLRAVAQQAQRSCFVGSSHGGSSNTFSQQLPAAGLISAADIRILNLSQQRCFSDFSSLVSGEDTGSKRVYISKTGRRKKPTRKSLANYAETLGTESELWPSAEKVLGKFPHLYNVPELVDPVMNEDEESGAMGNVTLEDFEEVEEHEDPPPYLGATRFLHWKVNYVFQVGDDMYHPMNRLVKLSFDVEEMQKNCDLTDAGLERFILLVGDRYKPARGFENGQEKPKGKITLTSNKYADREDNRRDLMQIFRELLKEAALAGTPKDPLLECVDYDKLVSQVPE